MRRCVNGLTSRTTLIACGPGLATLALAVGLSADLNTQPAATPVRVDPVVTQSVQRMNRVTGQLQPTRRSIVASEEDGIVLRMPFETGDAVVVGDVLAELDSDLLELGLAEATVQLDQAESSIDERRSLLEQAQRDLQSLEQLHARQAAQPKEVADARTALATAQARLRIAEHAAALSLVRVKRIERRLLGKVVRAPFDGVVVAKLAEVGQWVSIGGSIVEIIETGQVDAVLDVPQRYINKIASGLSLDILISGMSEPAQGVVRDIVPLANERARTFPTKVRLSDMQGRIMPGMSVTAMIPTGDLVVESTIHADAIGRSSAGTYVYAVRNGVAARVYVELGFTVGRDRVVVYGALEPGEQVVIEGNERISPGALLTVIVQESSTTNDSADEDDNGGRDDPSTRQ